MKISGQAVILRIFIGESDKIGHLPLYEHIVKSARQSGLAGATVLKGVLGFGATARIRTQKVLDLSSDLPMVVEIVDEQGKVTDFQASLQSMFEQAGSGGLVTVENVQVAQYFPHRAGEHHS